MSNFSGEIMSCSKCKYWIRDVSFPLTAGYCYAKRALVSSNNVCELFKAKEEGSVAIKAISYY